LRKEEKRGAVAAAASQAARMAGESAGPSAARPSPERSGAVSAEARRGEGGLEGPVRDWPKRARLGNASSLAGPRERHGCGVTRPGGARACEGGARGGGGMIPGGVAYAPEEAGQPDTNIYICACIYVYISVYICVYIYIYI